MWDAVIKKKKKKKQDSRVSRQLLASLESQGLRLCPAAENTNVQQSLTRRRCDTLPAQLHSPTYWGAGCSDAHGPLWSCRPGIASGALKSERPWREVYLTSPITFCSCPTLPSLLQGQRVPRILWLRQGPAHSTQIRTKASCLCWKTHTYNQSG